jgi:hypothetical protein
MENMVLDTDPKVAGCALISAAIVFPENSLFKIELDAQSSEVYASISDVPLSRYCTRIY